MAKNKQHRDGSSMKKRGSGPHLPSINLPEISARSATIGAVALTAGVAIGAALFRSWNAARPQQSEPLIAGTDADGGDIDGAGGYRDGDFALIDGGAAADVGTRAPGEFRPDRDAPVADDKRAAFAPATMPVPSRVAALGNGDEA